MPFLSTLGELSIKGYLASDLIVVVNGGMNVDLRAVALAQGWDGVSKVNAVIAGNVGSTSTANPALTIASFPNGVDLTVNAGVYVAGAGASSPAVNASGLPGGVAIKTTSPVKITNYGVIGGGGGSGGNAGGPGAGYVAGTKYAGADQDATLTTGATSRTGIAGGAIGQPGASGTGSVYTGGGGGLGGSGGNGRYGVTSSSQVADPDRTTTADGVDGTDVNNTADPVRTVYTTDYYGAVGGAAGAYIIGNNLVTWQVPGSRYGTVTA